jgi:hypothetical protein
MQKEGKSERCDDEKTIVNHPVDRGNLDWGLQCSIYHLHFSTSDNNHNFNRNDRTRTNFFAFININRSIYVGYIINHHTYPTARPDYRRYRYQD